MSAPQAAGASITVSASRSAAAVTIAPRECAAAASAAYAARVHSAPDAPGYCTTTPKTSPSGRPGAEVRDLDVDSQRLAPRPDDGDGLRQALRVQHHPRAGQPAHRPAHQGDGLGDGRALVQQGRVRGRQAGQVADHRLVRQQRLEPALRDLRLVRGVRGVPGRVFEHVAADHARRHALVVAEADHLGLGAVARGKGPQLGQHLGLARGRRDGEGLALGERQTDRGGHGGRSKFGQRGVADRVEHRRLLGCGRTDVAGDELAEELGQGGLRRSPGHARTACFAALPLCRWT